MADIGDFLEGYAEEGVVDSSGVFTIDPARAREKLAEFKLRSRHELILKFAQAGHLAASRMLISFGSSSSEVEFVGWSPEYPLTRISERLASPGLAFGDDAVGCLCVGLGTLFHAIGEGITLTHFLEGKLQGQVLEFDTFEIEKASERVDGFESTLIISWPTAADFGNNKMIELLKSRCLFLGIPIIYDGKKLSVKVPETPGNYQGQFFSTNAVLAARRYVPEEVKLGNYNEEFESTKKLDIAPRLAILKSTVDFEPMAAIWLSKAGVILEKKKFDVGLPGIAGVVAADDIETDLTGSQFREGEALEELVSWLIEEVQETLLPAAKKGALSVVADQTRYGGARAQDLESKGNFGVGCLVTVMGLMITKGVTGGIATGSWWFLVNWMGWPILGLLIALFLSSPTSQKPWSFEDKNEVREYLLAVLDQDYSVE